MKKHFLVLTILILSSSAVADRLVRLHDVSRESAVRLMEDGYDVANVDIRGGYVDIMLPEQDIDQAALLSHDYEVLPREWGELLPENMDNAGYYYSPEENWAVPDEIPAGVYTARISDGAGNCDSRRFTVMK